MKPTRGPSDKDIIAAALKLAKKQGVNATEKDCVIRPATTVAKLDKKTGKFQVAPATLWEVYIHPHNPSPNYPRGIGIQVEFHNGTLEAIHAWPLN
jgi:hypothetical protein